MCNQSEVMAGEDEVGENWLAGIAREWHDELSDPREDSYSLADGVPVDHQALRA